MPRTFLFILMIITGITSGFPQELTQTIKGRIMDGDTEIPLPGATVVIVGSDPIIGTVSDPDGYYRLTGIKPGRYDLNISFIGYEANVAREVLVGSARESIVNVGLKESTVDLGEVEIKAVENKKDPLNTMALVSARQINMEEANRFAGGFDDPAHLASSFAGVADNMNSNGIVIRGNAPKGLLWQMEGVQISNPSHFANMTTFGGGGITALSSKVMGHSDFYTGAFPAEYGNALSGVFDIRLRSGNRDTREHSVQVGITGIDVATEGPFKKGKGSTYLVNYRYSLFALLEPIMPENAGLIKYQDLSFKTDFPTRKAGTFSLWGIGATDYSGTRASEDPQEWKYDADRIDGDGQTYMGVIGLNHKYIIGKRTLLSSSLSASGNGIKINNGKLDADLNKHPYEHIENYSWKYSLATSVNHKFSPKHTNRTGVKLHLLNYDMLTRQDPDLTGNMITFADDRGRSELIEAFSQSRLEIRKSITLNIGIHAQYFTLNRRFTIEPRTSIRWSITPRHTLSLGYGDHSRLEILNIYLAQVETEGEIVRPNTDLDFTKARHFVLGYDLSVNENMRFKAEAYYQRLRSVPVLPNSVHSLINLEQDWFINDRFESTGTGSNYGLDLTLERFMNRGYYFLVTASLFKSDYTGGNGIRRNSRFDKNYIVNLVGGREWKVGRGHKNNLVSINGKFSLMGGDRMTPYDEEASLLAQDVIYDYERAFELRKPNVYYLHFTLNYRKNKPRHSSVWSFQVLNIMGSPEFFGYKYNFKDDTIDPDTQTIIMPNISYRIEF